ncbi:phosphotransferase [Roseobacter sp. HKCCA0434]|uniref:phosphotransferase n=1 Tax=Roseobacter sp. HKCCA0434 TaxID=3079297 RepID=UPI002905E04E|nr:phosphotransferase [Roseobacter sp. HKCCA0434]
MSLDDLHRRFPGAWQPLDGGLSHHVWRASALGGDVVIRAPQEGPTSPLFPRDAEGEWAVLQHLESTELAPEPVERCEGALVTRYVRGQAWQGDFAAAGAVFRKLHGMTRPAGLRCIGSDPVEAGRAVLAECIDTALVLIAPPPVASPGPTVLLHGDPTPANMLMRDGAAVLIDWQCPAVGPAAHDLALFLSPAMHLLHGGAPPGEEDRAAFFTAYGEPEPDEGLAAALHWMIACHCQWRIEQGEEAYRPALVAEVTALRRAAGPRSRRLRPAPPRG